MNALLKMAAQCPQCGAGNEVRYVGVLQAQDGQRLGAGMLYRGSCGTCHAQLELSILATAPTAQQLIDQSRETLDRIRGAGL
jgi:hypothetical protein